MDVTNLLGLPVLPIALGLFVGLIMGLSGAGGSILAIPLLVVGLELTLPEAAPISLLAIMAAASTGAIQGLYRGKVRYKAATLISLIGISIAPLGIWLAQRTPTTLLNGMLAAIMLYVAWRMWPQQASPALPTQPPAPCELNPTTSKLFWTASCTKRLIGTGAISGLLSGLLGVGGGFIIVPTLKKVSSFDHETIIATSLTIISFVSGGSVVMHLQHGNIDWSVAIPFVLSAMAGMAASSLLSPFISTQQSQRFFAILAVCAAVLMCL